MHDNYLSFQSRNGKRRILIVEDEPLNRDILGSILEDEYELLFAGSGEEALSVISAQNGQLSLVLLDLILPDLHGFEVLRRIKGDAQSARIPVIVLTSDSNAEVESLTLGAMDFLTKPYPEPRIIRARVNRSIELSEDRDIILHTERDQLTGLFNREYFYRYAEQYDSRFPQRSMDAIVVDINHFRMINERYGKAYGDEVLIHVGERLRVTVQEAGGMVCRREADIFLIYCPHRTDYAALLKDAALGLSDESEPNSRVRLRMGV